MLMKKLMAGMLLVTLAGVVQADDLANGIKAWEAQDFGSAHKLLAPLAAAGNAEAQLLLGEMYGFGEGVAENPALAERWLNKAQAGGHLGAAESLQALKQRGARKQEIAYYLSAHQGEKLTLESYGCVKPEIPPATTAQGQQDIRRVRASFDAWSACYERFGKGLVGKAIPQDLARLMSLSELRQARAAIDRADAAIAIDSSRQAREVVNAYNAWATTTRNYNVAMQKRLSDALEQERRKSDIQREGYRHFEAVALAGVK
jgi:hypothetical protein